MKKIFINLALFLGILVYPLSTLHALENEAADIADADVMEDGFVILDAEKVRADYAGSLPKNVGAYLGKNTREFIQKRFPWAAKATEGLIPDGANSLTEAVLQKLVSKLAAISLEGTKADVAGRTTQVVIETLVPQGKKATAIARWTANKIEPGADTLTGALSRFRDIGDINFGEIDVMDDLGHGRD